MKKSLMSIAVCFAACVAHAGVVTNFYADFQGAVNGSLDTNDLTTAAGQLDAGTPVGFWMATDVQESYMAANPAGNRRVAFDQGAYDFSAMLATNAVLAYGVECSIDFRNLRNGTVKENLIHFQDADGVDFLRLKLVPVSASTNDLLQAWDVGLKSWVTLSSNILENTVGTPNESGMQTLHVSAGASRCEISLDGIVLAQVAYEGAGTVLGSIRLHSENDASGVWYDDILVTTRQMKAGFRADFQAALDGSLDTNSLVTAAAQLNAGTLVGSWSVADVQESFMVTNAAGNRLLAFDLGLYLATAELASEAPLADGVEFSIDFRNLRGGTVKRNELRLKNESNQNLLSLRFEPTAASPTGSLQLWDTNTTSWVHIADIQANLFGTPNQYEMETLLVELDASGFSLSLNGNEITNGIAYANSGSSLNAVEFSGSQDQSGVWYDNINVVWPDTETGAVIGPIGVVAIAAFGASGMEFSWTAESAGTYTLQSRTNLLTGSWSNLVENITGMDGTLSVTTTPVSATMFYRVIGQ